MKQTAKWIVSITLIFGMPFVAYCGEIERQSAQAGTFEISAAQSLQTLGNEMRGSLAEDPEHMARIMPLDQDAFQVSPKDIFAQCADIDALTVRAWTLPEAVERAQSCLDRTYNRHPFSRRIYFVTAQADRFGVRACPEDAPVACQAIMLVEGIKITVSGRRITGDPVIEDIGYALQKRGRMLLGFHAILKDETEVWH